MNTVLVRVTIAVMKLHDLKKVGGKKDLFPYISIALFIIEGRQDRNSNRTGTWRQELMQRP